MSWWFSLLQARIAFGGSSLRRQAKNGEKIMIRHSGGSLFKALLGIAAGIGFFLVVMHQSSQLFR
jgi:hypothetical protein